MAQHKFLDLMRWELEEYLNLPLLAFLVASAIVVVLIDTGNPGSYRDYTTLLYGSDTVLLILALVAGAFFARSYAGSIGRGEAKIMLSYPMKRWQLFFSKFTALFLVTYAIYASAFSLHIYLDGLTVFAPMVLLTLFGLLLELMLACSVAIGISMVTKNEIISVLATVLMLFGVDSVLGYHNILSADGRVFYLLQYFGEQLYGTLPFTSFSAVTANETLLAVVAPIAIFVVLIVGAFLYFTRFMEVD